MTTDLSLALFDIAGPAYRVTIPACTRVAFLHLNLRNRDESLFAAAKSGHMEDLKSLLQDNGNVNASDNARNTLLMVACREGHKECVELLLDKGADVQARNIFGKTAQIFAEEKGDGFAKSNLSPTP